MIINFVGLFNKPGYVGEISDETHIARELEKLGHTVNRVQRDVFKAWCEGEEKQSDWVLPIKADFNLIAKWDKFDSVDYCDRLRAMSQGAPVFYWLWDFMDNGGLPEWHINMAKSADLYLSGELGIFDKYKALGVKPYYFQMDVCDGDIPTFNNLDKVYDVVFTGSCIGQGHRIEYLTEINKQIPITIFAWNPQDWFKLGFKECYPAVYGEEYNKVIAKSKIVLGLSVEPYCWGYWSNRIGKVIRAGGVLLQEYAPGMEQFFTHKLIEYFSSPQEAVEKIKKILTSPKIIDKYSHGASFRATSEYKVKRLETLMERYLKAGDKWLI